MMRTTTPILSILIAILLFIFFTNPQYRETRKIQSQIDEYNKATETYADFTKRLEEKLTKKSERSAYEFEKLDTLVPNEIDDTQYLVDLEALTKRHNMLFGNITLDSEDFRITRRTEESQASVPKDELSTVEISFEVVGTYEQFKSFLKDLEKSLTLFEVTHISFAAVEGPFQQFKLSVRTYALPSAK